MYKQKIKQKLCKNFINVVAKNLTNLTLARNQSNVQLCIRNIYIQEENIFIPQNIQVLTTNFLIICFWVLNATFNNTLYIQFTGKAVLSWQSVLLVEEGRPG